jgi:ParB family transcriptional regulator, chromosome partitioning protein
MSKPKRDLSSGFGKAHAVRETAIDRMSARVAAADALAGLGPEGEPATPQQAPRLALASTGQVDSTAQSLQVEAANGEESYTAEYRAWCARNEYTPGSITTLKLSSIKQSPFNPRHFYRKNSLAALALNLSSQGQMTAIQVTPDYEKEGEFYLNDGGRRVRSLRELQAKDVKAIIVDVPQGIRSYKLGYDLNTQHETQTVFDNAVVWKRLLDEKHFDSRQALAEEMNVDKSEVTATLSVGELPVPLIEEMLDSGVTFGMNMAYAIVKHYRAKGEKGAAALIRRIIDEGLSVRKVNEIVQRAENSSSPSPKRARYSERVEVKFFGDVHVGDLRTYGEDRLSLDLRGLDRAVRDRVQERIVAILAEEGNPDKLV